VKDKMPTHKAYTFASPTSPVTNQSLQKSMLSPTLKKTKNLSLLKKNKTLPTHSPTDKTIMTEQIENNKCMSLDKKEGQLVTRAKSKRADSGNLKCFATNKLYCNLTVLCFEMPASS
jgi:hypothetical protein